MINQLITGMQSKGALECTVEETTDRTIISGFLKVKNKIAKVLEVTFQELFIIFL